MPRLSLPPDQLLQPLAEAPNRIATPAEGLPSAALHTAQGEDEWSANEVLAHLRACADQWGGAIARIVAEDHPTLRAVNPRGWIKETNYLELDFHESLRAFAEQRAELVRALESLPPEGWSRSATVTVAGKPLERDVLFYANWLVEHERPHIKQIERVVAATGP